MVGSGGVRVVFGVGAVRDDEYLHILIQPAACPETVALVSVYLVERFSQLVASAFQFNVDEGESVDEDGHVVPRVVVSAFFYVLVDDLNEIVVYVVLVNEVDVPAFSGISSEDLDVIFLYFGSLCYNIIILVGDAGVEELLPLIVREMVVVEFLQLSPEVGNKVSLCVDREIFIPLLPKELDELWYASDVLTACSYSETTVYSWLSAMILYMFGYCFVNDLFEYGFHAFDGRFPDIV